MRIRGEMGVRRVSFRVGDVVVCLFACFVCMRGKKIKTGQPESESESESGLVRLCWIYNKTKIALHIHISLTKQLKPIPFDIVYLRISLLQPLSLYPNF